MSVSTQSLGSVGSAAACIVVSGSTNATPIVITLAAGHGLKNGDRLALAGITGNTNANGEWTLASVGATTATLVGSVGNGTHGGTVRAAVIFDTTPTMANHTGSMWLGGNAVGTLDVEAYGSYADFAAGQNNAGAVAPVKSPSGVTNSAGSASTPAKTTITLAATNAGFGYELRMARYMRAVVTAYTSGTVGVFVEA
jgi:hypothetical protein